MSRMAIIRLAKALQSTRPTVSYRPCEQTQWNLDLSATMYLCISEAREPFEPEWFVELAGGLFPVYHE